MGLSGYKSSHQNHIPVDRIVERSGTYGIGGTGLVPQADIIIGPQALAGRITMELLEACVVPWSAICNTAPGFVRTNCRTPASSR